MMQLKPMGIGDILDTAFRLCRQRFMTFAAIALVVAVPSALATALLVGAARAFPPIEQPDDDGLLNAVSVHAVTRLFSPVAAIAHGFAQLMNAENLGASLLSLLASVALILVAFVLVFSIAYPLCTGALVVNISASYLGENVGAGQSYVRAFRKLWRLLVAQGWTTMVVLFGLMLCVVPGLVLSMQLLLVPQVVLLEDHKAWAALGRSRALMADYLGKALGLSAVVWLLGLVIGAAVSTAVRIVPWPYPLIGDFLSYLIVELLMLPLAIATVVLLYYDLRIRKEAFDLQHLAGLMVEFRAL